MNNLEVQALKNSIKVAEEYPLLISAGNPHDILLLLQKCYLEGYVEGMKKAHNDTMKVVNDTLSKR